MNCPHYQPPIDDTWLNDLFSSSNSLFSEPLEYSDWPSPVPGSTVHVDGLFSPRSKPSTTSSTPHQDGKDRSIHKCPETPLLDSVSFELQKLKEQNRLTPKTLESVFNTQDVLKGTDDWPTSSAKQKHASTRKSNGSETHFSSRGKAARRARSLPRPKPKPRAASRGKSSKVHREDSCELPCFGHGSLSDFNGASVPPDSELMYSLAGPMSTTSSQCSVWSEPLNWSTQSQDELLRSEMAHFAQFLQRQDNYSTETNCSEQQPRGRMLSM